MPPKKKTTKKKTTKEIKVHIPQLMDVSLISEHPDNSNKQDAATFKNLKESMQDEGFDEVIIVAPRTDGKPGYWAVSGNHRLRSAVELGVEELPVVIRDDWDAESKQQKELLKRNLLRGEIGQSAFTTAIKQLRDKTGEDLNTIREAIGMTDPDKFAKKFKEESEEAPNLPKAVKSNTSVTSKVKMVDDLGAVVGAILAQYGDTVPYSYIIFPTAGKNHLFVQSSPSLKKTLEIICERCVRDNLDINIALAGLLAIGMANSDFKTTPDKQKIEDAGTEEGDGDL